jgi:hypothetical protein
MEHRDASKDTRVLRHRRDGLPDRALWEDLPESQTPDLLVEIDEGAVVVVGGPWSR